MGCRPGLARDSSSDDRTRAGHRIEHGDAGYCLDERDSAALLSNTDQVPRSYPAKLLTLLHARWRERPGASISIFPCELVASNGDTLRDVVVGLGSIGRCQKNFSIT
ncbi:hypothetical protein PPGU19_095890 (plasmid) [Paraburkholderia sp. PGU19]|nr:hypothetical protein PPGU19_095890 [Paraburkholderia sp. PGU19]